MPAQQANLALHQLPLALRPRDDRAFANFWVHDNPAPDLLRRMLRDDGERMVYLHGGEGTGKTHLLNALCNLAYQNGETAVLLPCKTVWDAPYDPFEGLEHARLLCLDDVQALAGVVHLEQALFHAINRCRESGTRLVFSAKDIPSALGIYLPDLVSRLGWGSVVRLKHTDAAGCAAILQMRAAELGLVLEPPTARYLVNTVGLRLPMLMDVLMHLERASMSAQRRLTLPFVRSVLDQV